MSDPCLLALMRDVVSIRRPRVAQTGLGEVLTGVYELAATAVPCALQPRGAKAAETLVGRLEGATHACYLEPCDVQVGDLLTEAKVGDTLQVAVVAGQTQVTVAVGLLQSGDRVEVGLGECSELNSVVAVDGQQVTLGTALRAAHSVAEPVTAVVVYEVLGVEDQAGAGHHLRLAVRRQEV
ncbi:hypothetical protein LLH03_07855 [bacterium]|nr:hypothetical protein [bacterium]